MKLTLRTQLLSYLVIVHGLFVGLCLYYFSERPVVFIASEFVLLLSFIIGFRLLRKTLVPLEYTQRFRDLLNDRNYAAQLNTSPSDESAELVQLFNTMLKKLYDERLKIGEQRGFLDQLLQATPSAVIVFDFDQRMSLLNQSAQTMLHLRDYHQRVFAQCHSDSSVWHPDASALARQRSISLMRQLEQLSCDNTQVFADDAGRRFRCTRSRFFDRGFAREFLLIDEITEELESSEKATYEKLVRVLAHEVNNTVAATGSVLDSLLFYQSQLDSNDKHDFITAIDAVKRRNSGLGEFIARFARVVKMPAPECRPSNLYDLLETIENLYREPCRTRAVQWRWRACDTALQVNIDRNLFEQALLNIVKNALEAAESHAAKNGGEAYIAIELQQEVDAIRLSIIDSGNGLSDVPTEQLFTPFFTTKKGGQGIGLLLVREVLNRHHCDYRLASNGHNETQFDIWFRSSVN